MKSLAKKIYVAMSGGVDSAVAALLLQKKGYEVSGVFMKNWSENLPGTDCPWQEDWLSLRQVCLHLGIPYKLYDFRKEYKKVVINYFWQAYRQGLTPNPDVMCNREIKFKLLWKKALAEGADYLATGHHARIKVRKVENKTSYYLWRGKDKNKDQSYFLYHLTQKQLAKVLMPIGDYQKAEIRKIAKKSGLPNWQRPDSQGVCFLGKIKLLEFLKNFLPEKPGKIVDIKGKVLGLHSGVHFYTIGQRQGLQVAAPEPFYVIAKDVKKNLLVVVSKSQEKEYYQREVIVKKVNWINGRANFPLNCTAKTRYRQPDQKCQLKRGKGSQLKVSFLRPQRAVTPGQSLVFYDGQKCLGGGIII